MADAFLELADYLGIDKFVTIGCLMEGVSCIQTVWWAASMQISITFCPVAILKMQSVKTAHQCHLLEVQQTQVT